MPDVVIVLAAGTTAIEKEISEAPLANLALFGTPKGLLLFSGKPSLTWWLDGHRRNSSSQIFVATCAFSFKAYERWAMDVGLPLSNILLVGKADRRRSSDACLDALQMALRRISSHITAVADTDSTALPGSVTTAVKNPPATLDQQDEITIIASDFLPEFELACNWKLQAARASVLRLGDSNDLLGIKIRREAIPLLLEGLEQLSAHYQDAAMNGAQISGQQALISWLSTHLGVTHFNVPQDSILGAWMQSETGIQTYHQLAAKFNPRLYSPDILQDLSHPSPDSVSTAYIRRRVYARIGIIGNPSDGFYGNTISSLISNFWAQVTFIPNPSSTDHTITILANRVCDPLQFASIDVASHISVKDGYDGAYRLILATLRVFAETCEKLGIVYPRRGGSILYETNIPRQVGLAGSSAIVTALIKCLFAHFAITDTQIPLAIQANLARSVEHDQLRISAGYQDRVVQAYGGCIFMSFAKQLMLGRGYGEYIPIDPTLVPSNMWMAFTRHPKESGKVHDNVRSRFESGEPIIRQAMETFAEYAVRAKTAIETRDLATLAQLMDANFDLRRRIYGDSVIGEMSLKIVALANEHGCAAKLSGSGGCVIGLWRGPYDADGQAREKLQLKLLRDRLEHEGFIFCSVKVPLENGAE